MFLMLLLFLTTVESELHGDNVCTFNNGTLHYKTIIKTTRVNTTESHCHGHNDLGHCIRWEYYKTIETPVNISYAENHLVHACCIGFQQIDETCEVCTHGTYGWRCQYYCSCPVNATCDTKNGHCSCFPGWQGQNCDEECPVGFFGHNCTSSCDCLYSGYCHKDTGKCFPGPGQVNEHTPDSTSPKQVSSIIYYVVIAVPAGFGLIVIILNAVLIYRCRLQKHLSERKDCSQRGRAEDYETIDDHFLSNNYVDMPHSNDTAFTVIDSEFPDETYNEIRPEIHHEPINEGQYTEVTCIIENTKHSHTSLSSCQENVTGNYDTMSRSWERDISDEYNNESDYNRLEKDLKSYDTFQSVKEASSMTSLPAYLDDNYSNVNMSEKGESLVSVEVGTPPP